VEHAAKYAQIVRTRFGGYEMVLPTKLNDELKPLMGKDFTIDVVEEGQKLRVPLTRDLPSQRLSKIKSAIRQKLHNH
jgi:hypothetical protein